jgi:hypothetical protein
VYSGISPLYPSGVPNYAGDNVPMMDSRARILSALITLSLVPLGAPATVGETRVFRGICDGSAAVELGQDTILVAYDEENALYAYRESGGQALARADLSGLLDLTLSEEIDIEAAALASDRIWWIGSHGLDGSGAIAPNRRMLFATNIPSPSLDDLAVVSGPLDLLEVLMQSSAIAEFLDDTVRRRHPKQGGINIEGLAVDGDGSLLVGFRSPLEKDTGLALVVRLSPTGNSLAVLDKYLVNLGKRGIRDMTSHGTGFAVLSGPAGDEGDFALYTWAPPGSPALLANLSGLNAEAVLDQGSHWLILSDDGKVQRTDSEAKKGRRQCDKIRRKNLLGQNHPGVYFRAQRLEKSPRR